jgi:hypothetical protein
MREATGRGGHVVAAGVLCGEADDTWASIDSFSCRWGGLGLPRQKPSCWGSVWLTKCGGVLKSDWENVIGEECTGVDGLGGGEQATREGGGNLAKNRKPAAGARFW